MSIAELWALGDYGRVAATLDPAAGELVRAAQIGAGQRVLDVAAGTGNVALAAAARGARVTASDITPELVALGRERARRADLDIEWEVADVTALPQHDGVADVVTSAFGAMFATPVERVTAELARVLRPGGTLAMANWVPEGPVSQLFALLGSYGAPPPAGTSAPTEWGREEVVAQRLAGAFERLTTERHPLPTTFPDAAGAWRFHAESAPPVVALLRTLDAGRRDELERRWIALADELLPSVDGGLVFAPGYLLVTARR
ncbi:MAG TPA: methyltransferase domain-containing protein, partial [Solirubrobacteraceae bacterium]|nr:methyltransferase domain-containing protein [Solirubrobacteraceae bacterium]